MEKKVNVYRDAIQIINECKEIVRTFNTKNLLNLDDESKSKINKLFLNVNELELELIDLKNEAQA